MGSQKSSISAQLQLSGQAKFKSGLGEVGRDARAFGKTMDSISSKGIGGGNRFTEMVSGIHLAGMAARGTGAIMRKAFGEDLSVEQLAMGLAAVSDGAETLSDQFAALKEASKLPGLGFTEMAKGSLTLQAVGVGAKQSRDMIIEFGNALATVGKGKNELDAITDALSKMAGKGSVTEEHLNIIAERYPAIRSIAQDLDKSSPLKFMGGLAEALSKLPRATGTAQDAIDNLGDAVNQFTSGKTGGRIQSIVGTLADGLAKTVNNSTNLKEGLGGVVDTLKNMAVLVNEPMESPLAKYELTPEQIKKRKELRVMASEEEAKAKQKVLDAEIEIANKEASLDAAKQSGDDEKILWATQELALLKEKQKLIQSLGVTEEQAAGHIRDRVEIELNGAKAVRDAEKQKAFEKANTQNARDLSLIEAKAGGKSQRQIKKLTKEAKTQEEEDRLISEGYSPAKAKELAKRKVLAEERIATDEQRAEAGLRPRVRSKSKEEQARARLQRLNPKELARLEGLSTGETAEQTFARKEAGGIKAYSGDDPMAMRPSQPSNLRKPIQGVGSKKKGDESTGAQEGGWQTLVNAILQVKQSVDKLTPNASDKSKPRSTAKR